MIHVERSGKELTVLEYGTNKNGYGWERRQGPYCRVGFQAVECVESDGIAGADALIPEKVTCLTNPGQHCPKGPLLSSFSVNLLNPSESSQMYLP